MQYNIVIKQVILAIILICMFFTSCTYDNEENLFEQNKKKEYNYKNHIKPYIDNNCLRCHTVSNPGGGVIYDNYKQVITGIKDGTFLGSIKYEKGISPMPPLPNPKTDNLKISIIEDWIEKGCKEKE